MVYLKLMGIPQNFTRKSRHALILTQQLNECLGNAKIYCRIPAERFKVKHLLQYKMALKQLTPKNLPKTFHFAKNFHL